MTAGDTGALARMQTEHPSSEPSKRLSVGASGASVTVIAAAKAAGVAPHVVRYYARIGLLRPRRDPRNGYKLFGEDDIKRLRFVRLTQTVGFTLAEVRKILRDADRGETPCPRVRDIVRQRIEENRRDIRARERL